MERHPRVMHALVRFSNLLAPVLSDGPDSATVAVLANQILATHKLRDVEVIPISAEPLLTEMSLFALQSGFNDWHALRLLIDQGKLPPDPRVHVRVHLNEAQWEKAGELAHEAADAHERERQRPIKRRGRARGARQRRTLVLSVV